MFLYCNHMITHAVVILRTLYIYIYLFFTEKALLQCLKNSKELRIK